MPNAGITNPSTIQDYKKLYQPGYTFWKRVPSPSGLLVFFIATILPTLIFVLLIGPDGGVAGGWIIGLIIGSILAVFLGIVLAWALGATVGLFFIYILVYIITSNVPLGLFANLLFAIFLTILVGYYRMRWHNFLTQNFNKTERDLANVKEHLNRQEFQVGYESSQKIMSNLLGIKKTANQIGNISILKDIDDRIQLCREIIDLSLVELQKNQAQTRTYLLNEERKRTAALTEQATQFENSGNYEEAIKCYQKLNLPAEIQRVCHRQALDLESAGRWDEAAMVYDRIGLRDDANRARYTAQTKIAMQRINQRTAPVAPSQNRIETKREWEYFGGTIRLRFAVINHSDALIADTRLRPVFEEAAFSFDRVEPDTISMKGNDICLGNISPGEKRSCAIYLDPLVCSTSNVEGILNYRDSQGNLASLIIPPLKVAVSCPIFFTPETANVAAVKNLVDNVLEKKDSKVYTIPTSLDPSKAFTLAKEAIQVHAIRHVKDFSSQAPWVGEAWYYGLTKESNRPFILIIRGFGQDRSLAITAYAESAQNICGLLAEIHTQFNLKLQDARYISEPLRQITNITIRDSIINRSSLLIGDNVATGSNAPVCE